jgi:hypothetical protein
MCIGTPSDVCSVAASRSAPSSSVDQIARGSEVPHLFEHDIRPVALRSQAGHGRVERPFLQTAVERHPPGVITQRSRVQTGDECALR